jgi:hypothetical protein
MTGLHEEAARTRKALRLRDVLIAHGATALEAAAMPALGWDVVAQLGGCRPPSDATKAQVVLLLESREAEALRCGPNPDPFAGLPGCGPG